MPEIRLGFAPITWNNEDLGTELGPPVPFETVLDEVVAAGYSGTELGDGFPRDPAVLRQALEQRGLVLTSAWCGLRFFDASPEEDLERTRRLCELLAGVGASFVNLAHQGSPQTSAWAGRFQEPSAPRLSDAEMDQLAERVCSAARIAQEAGLQALFHQHAGTWIESRAALEALLARVPAPLLQLCFDVGHALYGGIDPIDIVRTYPERIAYLHLKDLDDSVLDGLRREEQSFETGVRRRVFTEVGRGSLDVPGLLAALRDIGYSGWLMVEQDSTWLEPSESARTSRAYLRSLGL